ncbi:MAG: FAD-dependent oxidoreductase, partial [Anaerolineae bacterium]|nr:FAD-dependent oxidoreductase [Anaerolineae bacterium]
MSDVIVIGGGLTGLSAAWELERLGVNYTLIEVKPRLGGSIHSECMAGFVIDHGPFVLEKYGDWPFLAELGLQDSLMALGRYRDGELVIFREGTQTLVEALVSRLTAT